VIEAEERAERRAREAEERAERLANNVEAHLEIEREARLSTGLRQSQEAFKTVEAKATHTDALMARIMARLDDQSCHGPSVIV
jgi:hypothetical protein